MPAGQLLPTFTLSMDDVQLVKDTMAADGASRRPGASLVATLGLVWSCYQRAKEATPSSPTPTGAGGDDHF